MQDGEWRGITKGAVAEPAAAFGYLQRGFRQQLGAVVGQSSKPSIGPILH